uniref:Uncharacterized protein n=1 Tax=Ixodes ricinus TaxID=34613 RepID=A0A6B0UL38_IXORI
MCTAALQLRIQVLHHLAKALQVVMGAGVFGLLQVLHEGLDLPHAVVKLLQSTCQSVWVLNTVGVVLAGRRRTPGRRIAGRLPVRPSVPARLVCWIGVSPLHGNDAPTVRPDVGL